MLRFRKQQPASDELLKLLDQRLAAIEFRQERFRVILGQVLELLDEQIKETRRRLSERIDGVEELLHSSEVDDQLGA